jgi:hypothetical protein
MTSSGV